MIISVLITGCIAAGGMDFRFNSVKDNVIDIDGYRVNVRPIKVSDSIYDVMASPNVDDLSYSELNNDFLSQYSRLRRGAEIILKNQIGEGKEIITIDEIKPTSWKHMYMRFKVTEKK